MNGIPQDYPDCISLHLAQTSAGTHERFISKRWKVNWTSQSTIYCHCSRKYGRLWLYFTNWYFTHLGCSPWNCGDWMNLLWRWVKDVYLRLCCIRTRFSEQACEREFYSFLHLYTRMIWLHFRGNFPLSSSVSNLLHLPPPTSPPFPSSPNARWCLAGLIPQLKRLAVNPSQFSALWAPIKKGLACVICQTIVPSHFQSLLLLLSLSSSTFNLYTVGVFPAWSLPL